MCRVYKRGLRWLNAKELGLNWNGLERDVGASSMLNEERSFSSLEEVTKLVQLPISVDYSYTIQQVRLLMAKQLFHQYLRNLENFFDATYFQNSFSIQS